MATKFIFNKSSVTYCPPKGYYRNFGVGETRVDADVITIDEDDDNNANQDSNNMIVDNVSCRKNKNNLKKPKTGFLENQIIKEDKGDEGGAVFSDADLDTHDETLEEHTRSLTSTRQFRNGS